MEEDLLHNLWQGVNNTIKVMGRPDRLFSIDKNKTAMLVIDMQDGFCSESGCLENPDTRKIVPNINILSKKCREVGIPVIWVRFIVNEENIGLWKLLQSNSPYPGRKNPTVELSENGNENKIWHDLIIDEEKDIKVIKNKYSSFVAGSSNLNQILKEKGINTLIITGVGTNVCCESTARDAMMLNYKVIFISDANATIGKVFHEVSLMNIKMFFGDVASTNDILKEL